MGDDTPVDAAFGKVRCGDSSGFADWLRLVEPGLRRSLRSFARQVDVEAVLQESLLRMWVLATRLELSGADASLRYVLRLARNLALREAERQGRFEPIDDEALDEQGAVQPPNPPDPALRATIVRCLDRLPGRSKQALLARIGRGARPDRALAESLGLRLNTFLQNVVRARKALLVCLETHGISLRGVLR